MNAPSDLMNFLEACTMGSHLCTPVRLHKVDMWVMLLLSPLLVGFVGFFYACGFGLTAFGLEVMFVVKHAQAIPRRPFF